jgi:excisionase family DNA binding protein
MPLLLDLEEAARFLRTSTDVVERLARSGEVAAVRIGDDIAPKFTAEALAGYIERAAKAAY